MISVFIEKCREIPHRYNEYEKGTPGPPDTEDLRKLLCRKKSEWKLCLNEFRPGMVITQRKRIENGEINCVINNFFQTFEKILGDDKLVFQYENPLRVLENGLLSCTIKDCPCPAGMRD